MQTSATPRPRRIAQLSPIASTLRLELTRWALAEGRRVSFDAITVILAAKLEDGAPLQRWTEDDVWRLWWIDLSGWCARRGLRTPDGLATSMLSLFAYLQAVDGFAPGSDGYPALEHAMESAGALWQNPTSLPAG